LIGIGCVGLAITLAISALICGLLFNLQKAVPAEHRKIEPGLVWLLLIPLFNLVWNFFVFLRVAESYKSYFASVGQPQKADAEWQLGLWYSICVACSIIPCVQYAAGPAALVLLIIYMVKMYGLKGEIGRYAPVPTPSVPPTSPTPPPPAPPAI
jgi:hypothetical protein